MRIFTSMIHTHLGVISSLHFRRDPCIRTIIWVSPSISYICRSQSLLSILGMSSDGVIVSTSALPRIRLPDTRLVDSCYTASFSEVRRDFFNPQAIGSSSVPFALAERYTPVIGLLRTRNKVRNYTSMMQQSASAAQHVELPSA